MATYVPNATQTSEPVASRTVESAALEFRTLKTSVNSRIAAEETTRGNADTNLQGQITALSGAIVGGAVAAIVTSQEIVGDGVTATYTLSAEVGSSLHVDLYIDGAHQQPSSYTVVLDQLTLSEVPHDGALMTVKIGKPIAVGVSNALLVEYDPAGLDAVATTVQAKLRESVSVLDFIPVGTVTATTNCTSWIQAALDMSANVYIPPGTYKCESALTVSVVGQVISGAGRDLTFLDFTSSEINGLNMNGCEGARLENFTILGTYSANTSTNAGINVVAWARGTASNMRVTGFSRGITWENASRGWMLGMLDMYFYNNYVGALLAGAAHACSFRGGEVAQGRYGVVLGQLNADGTINDDASANFGGAFSAHGTIIEGQDDYMVVIGNNQLGAAFSGCYIETSAVVAPQAFFRIGSKFLNDNVTPATGYPKGLSITGCMMYASASTPAFPAVKLEALLGGEISGNVISGNVLDFIDTTALRQSYGVSVDANELSGSGLRIVGTSDAVSIGGREYPVTNSSSGYLKKYYGWSGSAWEATMTIPATSTRGPTFDKQPIFSGGMKLENTTPADGESMNYYKADVFTPTVIGSSTAGTASYSVQSGAYTRIGDRVFFDINLTYTGGTGTGNLQIAGLPFTTNGSRPSALSIYASNLTYTGSLSALTNVNATTLSIYEGAGSALVYDGAATLIVSGSYWV